jgi:hypothetical protein
MFKNALSIVVLLIAIIFIFSCNVDPQEGNTRHDRIKYFFDNKERVSDLLRKSMENGDTIAYKEIHQFYYEDGREQEITYLSMMMANKYNYPAAYFDVYSELSHRAGGFPLLDLDKRTRNIALYYLALAKEKGFPVIEFEWNQAYGDEPIPSSNSFLIELTKLDSAK